MRKPRHADVLRGAGYQGDVAEFRRVLAEVKTEKYPDVTDEELAFTKNEATQFCAEVNRRLGTKLGRVFLLKALVGIRKARKVRTRKVESVQMSIGTV